MMLLHCGMRPFPSRALPAVRRLAVARLPAPAAAAAAPPPRRGLRSVPSDIERPPYAVSGRPPRAYPPVSVHGPAGVARMRDACAAARDLLSFAVSRATAGSTTDEIDEAVHAHCVGVLRAYPSPLNYGGFPKSLCASLNAVVCHGIPAGGEAARLRSGDVLKLDVSVYLRGYHGDTCATVLVGGAAAADAAARALDGATAGALAAAIAACGPGVRVAALGALIEPRLAAAGFAPVREYAGHGIGTSFHTLPIVMHHRNDVPEVMRPGMTFTIEPCVVEGRPDIELAADGWTVTTVDGRRAAQYEHTVLITEHGAEVLTAHAL